MMTMLGFELIGLALWAVFHRLQRAADYWGQRITFIVRPQSTARCIELVIDNLYRVPLPIIIGRLQAG
jgi:hypothetical protein